MPTKQIREKTQAFLIKGEIEQALSFLLSELDSNVKRRDYDNALIIRTQWENLKQDQIRGILTRQEYEVSVNKIIAGIQNITNNVDYPQKKGTGTPDIIENNYKKRRLGYILISAIAVLIFSIWYLTNNKTTKTAESSASPATKVEGSKTDNQASTSENLNQNNPTDQTPRTLQNKSVQRANTNATPPKQYQYVKTDEMRPIKTQETAIESQKVIIILNGNESKLSIDDKPLPGSGVFNVNLTLGTHKFEIIEALAAQKCIQIHTIEKSTTKLFLTCN